MGRTATFKAGERRVRPTGSDAGADKATENALFREVDDKGNPVTTTQSEGTYPLDASAPAEVVTDSRELSELDVKADETEPVFEPTEEELAQFDSLRSGGLSEAEAAAEVWPGVEFTSDDETVEETVEETTSIEDEINSDSGSTEGVVESEEAAPEAEETAEGTVEIEETAEETAETVTPDDETSWGKPYPQGNPVHAWKVGQIDAWAADQNPVVEFPEGATKDQKLNQLKTAAEEG